MLNNFDVVFNRKKISLFIGWFLSFTPPLLLRFSALFTSVIRYSSVFYIALLFVIYKPPKIQMTNRKRHFIATVLFFLIWSCVVVFYQSKKSFMSFIKSDIMSVIEVYILLRCSINAKSEEPEEKLKDLNVLYYLMWTYLVLNFFSIILFPNGVIKSLIGSSVDRANWFLGSKNNQSIYLLLIVSFICLYNIKTRKKRYGLIGILMALFCAVVTGSNGFQILEGSSVGIIVMLFFLMVYILSILFEKKFVNIRFIYIYSGVCIINYSLLSNSIFSAVSLVTKVFNKSVTFSGRTYVWDSVKSYISQKPWIGYGEPQFNYLSSSMFSWASESSYTYNLFLKVLFSFGIIGFVLMSLIFIQLPRKKDQHYTILAASIIGVFIIGLMYEVKLNFLLLFPFIIMMVYGDNIPKIYKKQRRY